MAVSLKKIAPVEYEPEHIMTEEQAIAFYRRKTPEPKAVDYAAVEHAATHSAEIAARLQADIEAETARIAEKEKELENQKKREAELDAQLAIFRSDASGVPAMPKSSSYGSHAPTPVSISIGGVGISLFGVLFLTIGLYWTEIVSTLMAGRPEAIEYLAGLEWAPRLVGAVLITVGTFKLMSKLLRTSRW